MIRSISDRAPRGLTARRITPESSTPGREKDQPMERLVVIGNGMSGVACVEQILKHAPKFEITIFGEETYVNYNRILLSSVLAGEKGEDDIIINDVQWYNSNGIT